MVKLNDTALTDVKSAAFEPLKLPINSARPLTMHIDMNSSFATIEQQANPLLRGRPIAVSPYTSPNGIIITPSVEAKEHGIKLGTRNFEAKKLCPDLIVLPPDPPKYRDAHLRFKKIFRSYTDHVVPKSIDEAVIEFSGSSHENRDMEEVGQEIKDRIKDELGEWVRVSVGIGPNNFLAKVAAGMEKPDGLNTIDHNNLLNTYAQLELMDLPGINTRYDARLRSHGIFSPLDLFSTPMLALKKEVFKSIIGYYWYVRLRGWEVDTAVFGRKTFGHSYALGQKTSDRYELSKMIMKLCEKTGRRLRRNKFYAHGIHISMRYSDHTHWGRSHRIKGRMYTTQDIFKNAMKVFDERPEPKVVKTLAISVLNLQDYEPMQTSLLDGTRLDYEALVRALDELNDRYGEYVVTPALMMDMGEIKDRIAFGGIKDLEMFYQEDEIAAENW